MVAIWVQFINLLFDCMVNYFKKYHIQLSIAVILLLFVIVKLPAISLPYFWDELGVYARAGLYLHDNGLGLLPKNLPPELSRGHPLLFSFIHGIGYFIFGDSNIGGHITALIISVTLLWSVFYISKYHYNAYSGLLAVMLLIVQPVFFAQAALILPEICVALFMIWAIHLWTVQQYWGYAIMATAAILVKESAVIIPTVIIAAEILDYLFKKSKQRKFVLQFSTFLLFVPYLVYILFLVIQKAQNGWYLFPLHEDQISITGKKMTDFAEMFFSFLLLEQGRIVLTIITLLLLVLFKRAKLYQYNRFSIFLWMFILGGILFSSLNFFMNRYLLFAFIPIMMLLSVLFVSTAKHLRFSLLFIPIVFAACLYTLYGKQIYVADEPRKEIQDRFNYDENMSYTYFLDAQQQTIDFLMANVVKTDSIFGNFPTNIALAETRFGFTDKVESKDFHVKTVVNSDVSINYLVTSNPGSINNSLPSIDSVKSIFTINAATVVFNIYVPLKPIVILN